MSQRTADYYIFKLFGPTGWKGAWQWEWPVTKRCKTSKQIHVTRTNFVEAHTLSLVMACPAPFNITLHQLSWMISKGYITGDFNICYFSEAECTVFKELKTMVFRQLVKHSTHLQSHLLGHFYTNSHRNDLLLEQEAPYFSHHAVLFVFRKKSYIRIHFWCVCNFMITWHLRRL